MSKPVGLGRFIIEMVAWTVTIAAFVEAYARTGSVFFQVMSTPSAAASNGVNTPEGSDDFTGRS